MPKRKNPETSIEEWRDIEGYVGRFKISNLGRVKSMERSVSRKGNSTSIQKEMIKKQRLTKYGYLTVYLSISKKYKHYFVHRLVAKFFISDSPTKKHTVNHKNGIKTDNRVENLEWVTHSENLKHAFRMGLMCQKGENHANPKLNNKIVLKIFRSKKKAIELSSLYKISTSTVYNIKTGKGWSHLTKENHEKE